MKSNKKDFTEYYAVNTRKATAIYYGVSEVTIKKWAKECGCSKSVKKSRPDKDDFALQYLEKTQKELADYYDVPKRRIQYWAKIWNIHKSIKKVPELELIDFYSRHTLEDTAENFGISASYVFKLAKSYGFKKPTEMIYRKKSKSIPCDIDEFKQYYLTHTNEDTAKEYGVSRNVIMKWRHELGIPDKTQEQINVYKIYTSRAFVLPNAIEFRNLYEITSNDEVANYYNVSRASVDKWREELKIPRKQSRWKDYPDYKLSQFQYDIIIGSLLGDGGLTAIDENNNAKFTETHGSKQKEYLLWKYEQLKPLSCNWSETLIDGITRIPSSGKVIKDSNKPQRLSVCMQTMVHPVFTDMERKWYKRDDYGNYIFSDCGRRIKCLPSELNLTPRMIAIWYFDDGSNHNTNGSCSIVFNTQSFSFTECERLVALLGNFGFKARINTNRGKPIIRIRSCSYLSFIEMINDFLPTESMRYKLDLSKYNFDKKDLGVKMFKEDVIKIVSKLDHGVAEEEILKEFSISKKSLQSIRLGRTWKKITNGKIWKYQNGDLLNGIS